jgi:hypothetical protein
MTMRAGCVPVLAGRKPANFAGDYSSRRRAMEEWFGEIVEALDQTVDRN